VLRGVAVLSAIGLAIGLACFAGVSRLLESRVYGVSAMDFATIAAMSAALVAAAFAGAWLPTRRATRVDPATSLRAD
jgi:putative ABC transport system permease protein